MIAYLYPHNHLKINNLNLAEIARIQTIVINHSTIHEYPLLKFFFKYYFLTILFLIIETTDF